MTAEPKPGDRPPRDGTVGKRQPATQPIRLNQFVDCIGEHFELDAAGSRKGELTLVEAKALATGGGLPREEPFALLFRAPPGCELGQGIVRLQRRDTGSLELFLVPVASDNEGVYFEAVFN